MKQPQDSPAREFSLHLPNAAEARHIKVVVADDDEIVREIVCAPLRRWAFEVVTARDGAEALAALQEQNGPVLAILDWVMPRMNGLEVCRRVRAAGKHVYILLLTARSGKQDIAQGLQAGADDYLIKRTTQEELYVRLRLGIRILCLESQLAARKGELVETTS